MSAKPAAAAPAAAGAAAPAAGAAAAGASTDPTPEEVTKVQALFRGHKARQSVAKMKADKSAAAAPAKK